MYSAILAVNTAALHYVRKFTIPAVNEKNKNKHCS